MVKWKNNIKINKLESDQKNYYEKMKTEILGKTKNYPIFCFVECNQLGHRKCCKEISVSHNF